MSECVKASPSGFLGPPLIDSYNSPGEQCHYWLHLRDKESELRATPPHGGGARAEEESRARAEGTEEPISWVTMLTKLTHTLPANQVEVDLQALPFSAEPFVRCRALG